MSPRRVAITGLGLVSPFGGSLGDFFARLLAGESAIRLLHTNDLPRPLSMPFAGCPGFDAEAALGRPLAGMLDRFAQLGVAAALAAWDDAGLPRSAQGDEREDWGVAWGTALGGTMPYENGYRDLWQNGKARLSPLTLIHGLNNAANAQISIQLGLGGVSMSHTVACASSSFAVRVNSYGTSNNVISGNNRAHYFGGVPYLKVLHSGNFSQQATAAIAVTSAMNVAVVTYTESSRTATIIINGFAADTAQVPANTDPAIYLGAYAQANFLSGDIAEAVIFDRVLTPTEVSGLQSSCIARYRVPVPLPYSTPAEKPLLWLKADSGITTPAADGKVTRWNDCRGNNYSAWQDSAQWQPVLLPNARFNLPGVRFAGAGNFMQATSVFPTRSDYTLTFVVRVNNLNANNNVVSAITHAHWFGGAEYAKGLYGDFNSQAVACQPRPHNPRRARGWRHRT